MLLVGHRYSLFCMLFKIRKGQRRKNYVKYSEKKINLWKMTSLILINSFIHSKKKNGFIKEWWSPGVPFLNVAQDPGSFFQSLSGSWVPHLNIEKGPWCRDLGSTFTRCHSFTLFLPVCIQSHSHLWMWFDADWDKYYETIWQTTVVKNILWKPI